MPSEIRPTTILPSPSSLVPSIGPIFNLYASLAATFPLDAQSGLGGKLLYAGEIDFHGRELLYAANIAGAASLAASADPVALRQGVRDGVIDFLVTSLEEALRILKNEIRKKQAVSVGVSVAPGLLAAAMLERGVLPDLLPFWDNSDAAGRLAAQGAHRVAVCPDASGAFVTWSVDREFVRWMPRLDACVKGLIPAEDVVRQRWMRLAPRYLGRLAQREHGVWFSLEEADQLRTEAAKLVAQHAQEGGQAIGIEIQGQPV